jgi:hypothetical protein
MTANGNNIDALTDIQFRNCVHVYFTREVWYTLWGPLRREVNLPVIWQRDLAYRTLRTNDAEAAHQDAELRAANQLVVYSKLLFCGLAYNLLQETPMDQHFSGPDAELPTLRDPAAVYKDMRKIAQEFHDRLPLPQDIPLSSISVFNDTNAVPPGGNLPPIAGWAAELPDSF